jgi:hypothetical protein
MYSTNHDNEIETEEQVDLYSLVKKNREDRNVPLVARLLYVAYINEGLRDSYNIDVEKQMSEWKKPHEEFSELKGFYLVKNLFCIHFLEGDSIKLNKFLRFLHAEKLKDKSYYQIINIIAFNEENQDHKYARWYSESAHMSGPTLSQDIEKSD